MAKKQLYLHIGLGKTGTTSLQTFFWANRKPLAKYGILYPTTGAVAGAHHLLSPHIPPFLKDVWDFVPTSKWAPELAQAANMPVLLSSELTSSAKPDVVARFGEELLPYFDTKVIIYLRRQDHLIVAGYSQQIKAGTQKMDIGGAFARLFGQFDFKARLMPWIEAFGAENLILRPYERRQLIGGDIRKDFLSGILGIDDLSGFQTSTTNENPRFAYPALEYKRMINNVIPDTQASTRFNEPLLAYSAAIDSSSTAIFHESDLLAAAERKMVLNRVRPVNAWIAKDLMGRNDGILFQDPEPDVDLERIASLKDVSWSAPSVTDQDLAEIGTFLTSKKYDKELLQHIEQALRENRFEAYRYAGKLAASVGT
ncbi:hypothetical protein V6C03_10790 [Methyloligella sp. 2.7D]|uniref:hypothetical protein n=1 Tax=unclassified Methyloligella TaxID=2625955 RepID=UPI00157DA332|nr:hypothetical protein [Methyloligella sp. GL2]QKP77688.1 hypothetical protein HT051_09670 [Methyloligella sp. GL2]